MAATAGGQAGSQAECVLRKFGQVGSGRARLHQRKVSELEPPSGDSELTSTLTQATFSWLRRGGGRHKVSHWLRMDGGISGGQKTLVKALKGPAVC